MPGDMQLNDAAVLKETPALQARSGNGLSSLWRNANSANDYQSVGLIIIIAGVGGWAQQEFGYPALEPKWATGTSSCEPPPTTKA
jgi:hypothetical protein